MHLYLSIFDSELEDRTFWYGRWQAFPQFFTHTRKFRCSPLFAICRTFTGRIAHRHVVILSCLLCADMDIHLVFSPFTARQFPLLATRHLSSLIISCAALLVYTDTPFNACVRTVSHFRQQVSHLCVDNGHICVSVLRVSKELGRRHRLYTVTKTACGVFGDRVHRRSLLSVPLLFHWTRVGVI